jgi:hypothetical protein
MDQQQTMYGSLIGTYYAHGTHPPKFASFEEMAIEYEVSKFKANQDPLFRLTLYSKWFGWLALEKENLVVVEEFIAIKAISEQLTRSQLKALISEFEASRTTMNKSDLSNRQFTVKRGLLKKPYSTTGAEIERRLPKLRLLVTSTLWKST